MSPVAPSRGTVVAAAARHAGSIVRSVSATGSVPAAHLDSGLTGSSPYGWLPTTRVRSGPSGRTLAAYSCLARATSWASGVSACIVSKKYWNVTCHMAACIAAIAGSTSSSPPATAPVSTPSAVARRARSLAGAGGSPAATGTAGVRAAGVLFVGVPGSSRATPSRWA